MSKLSKVINCIVYVFVIFSLLSIVSKYTTENQRNLPISLWYVYSESMEPTLMTDDGFFLIRAKEYRVDDIITFVPETMKQPYVTHRITGTNEKEGFITKGDNNPMSDQQGGEPPVSKDQIIGKALTFNGKILTVPQLGTFVKLKSVTKGLSTFTIISIAVIVIAFGYIYDTFFDRARKVKKRKSRLLDIAQYFDYCFIILSILILINAFLICITARGWDYEEISYIVVSTEGLPSPVSGERFSREFSLQNRLFIPFIMILESKNPNLEITPKSFSLMPGENKEYEVSLTAPESIGHYSEKYSKRAYPYILPAKLFDMLYSINCYLPLLIIFIPGLLLTVAVYLWWMRRWRIGKREVMPWLLYLRNVLRSL